MISISNWPRLERWVVVLIALHSYAVGLMLMFATEWTLNFAGWEVPENLFFPRQGGVFHLVVATGYLFEYFRFQRIQLLIIAKSIAVVFLLALSRDTGAWAVPFSGVTDGLMLIVAVWVHVKARKQGSF
jgi:hypothetical protein